MLLIHFLRLELKLLVVIIPQRCRRSRHRPRRQPLLLLPLLRGGPCLPCLLLRVVELHVRGVGDVLYLLQYTGCSTQAEVQDAQQQQQHGQYTGGTQAEVQARLSSSGTSRAEGDALHEAKAALLPVQRHTRTPAHTHTPSQPASP